MLQTLTAKLKLVATSEHKEMLRVASLAYRDALNFTSEVAYQMGKTFQGRGDAENGRRGERIQTGTETPTEFKRLKSKISVGVLDPWDLRPRVAASPRLRVFFDNGTKIQKEVYYTLRERFKLPSQMACNVPRQVGATYKSLRTKLKQNEEAIIAGRTKN